MSITKDSKYQQATRDVYVKACDICETWPESESAKEVARLNRERQDRLDSTFGSLDVSESTNPELMLSLLPENVQTAYGRYLVDRQQKRLLADDLTSVYNKASGLWKGLLTVDEVEAESDPSVTVRNVLDYRKYAQAVEKTQTDLIAHIAKMEEKSQRLNVSSNALEELRSLISTASSAA